MRRIQVTVIGMLFLTGGIILLDRNALRGRPAEDKPMARDDAENPKDWREAYMQLRTQIQDRANDHSIFKADVERLLKEQAEKIQVLVQSETQVNTELRAIIQFLEKNNTRIGWRKVDKQTPTSGVYPGPLRGLKYTLPDNAQRGDRFRWGKFEVDFAPDVPMVPEVCVSGIACARDEHNVSNFYADTRNVTVSGTKVTGEYRFNLSDHDNNSSYTNDTKVTFFVIAKLNPTEKLEHKEVKLPDNKLTK